jgi:hypothetical protein
MDVSGPHSTLLSVREVKLILPLSSWKILDLAKQRLLPSVRLGNKYFFDVRDILRLKQYGTPTPTPATDTHEAATV